MVVSPSAANVGRVRGSCIRKRWRLDRVRTDYAAERLGSLISFTGDS